MSQVLIRRPLLSVAGLLILGIAVHRFPPHRPGVYLAIAAVAVFIGGLWRHRIVRTLCIAGAVPLSGLALAQIDRFAYPAEHIGLLAAEEPRLAHLHVRVTTAPRIVDRTPGSHRPSPRQIMQADVQAILTTHGWQRVSGQILLHVMEPIDHLAHGDQIQILGWLSRPNPAMNPGQFDWSAHYRRDRILASVAIPHAGNVTVVSHPGPDWLTRIRLAARKALAAGFDENDVNHALLRALVLGDADPQLRDIQDLFMRTGTSHHLAISGMHIAMLGLFVFGICRLLFIAPRPAVWTGLTLVILYALVVLPSPPVIRSVLLCIAFAAGVLSRRSIDGIQLLSASAFAMLIYRPLEIYGAGFQLSFVTVLGLMLFTTPVMRWIDSFADPHARIARQVRPPTGLHRLALVFGRRLLQACVAGAAAWFVSMPLVSWHFNQLNPWAILASLLLAIPVMAALAFGLLKIAMSLIFPTVPFLANIAAWPVMLMRWSLDALDHLPGSDWPMPQPCAWRLFLCYGLLLLPLVPIAWSRLRLITRLAPIACLLVILPLGAASGSPNTRLVLLSVGAGQCAVLHLPSGKTIVIDAGSATIPDAYRTILHPYLKHMAISKVDALFISHANLDHYNAAPGLLSNYAVDRLYLSPTFALRAADGSAASVLDVARNHNIPIEVVHAGQSIGLDATTAIDILWPPQSADSLDPNESSLVLRITACGRSILLPGDIQERAQSALLRGQIIPCDVLVAPHHGGMEKTTAKFLAACSPRTILSSNSGRLSQKQRAFDCLLGPASTLHRTHICGAIEITVSPTCVLQTTCFRPESD